MFLVAIVVGYGMLGWIVRKAGRMGKDKKPLWWLVASAPFLLVRGAYGVLSSADWQYSYYIPDNVSGVTTVSHICSWWHASASTSRYRSLHIISNTRWWQYGANGLKQSELLAEYLMAVTMEALALFCIMRAVLYITVKKQLFVPYDERDTAATSGSGSGPTGEANGTDGGERLAMKESRGNRADGGVWNGVEKEYPVQIVLTYAGDGTKWAGIFIRGHRSGEGKNFIPGGGTVYKKTSEMRGWLASSGS
jgi:hypothetical protein